MGRSKPVWLYSEAVKTYCRDADVDYEEYRKAIEYMAGKGDAQRKFMLSSLRKHLKMRG